MPQMLCGGRAAYCILYCQHGASAALSIECRLELTSTSTKLHQCPLASHCDPIATLHHCQLLWHPLVAKRVAKLVAKLVAELLERAIAVRFFEHVAEANVCLIHDRPPRRCPRDTHALVLSFLAALVCCTVRKRNNKALYRKSKGTTTKLVKQKRKNDYLLIFLIYFLISFPVENSPKDSRQRK